MSPDQYTNVPSLCLSCNVYFLGDFVFFEFFSFVFHRNLYLAVVIAYVLSETKLTRCNEWRFFLCHAKKSFFICANLNLLLDEIFAILPVLCKFFLITYHNSSVLNCSKTPSPIVSSSFPWRNLFASIKRIEISSGRHLRVGRGWEEAFMLFYIFTFGGYNISINNKNKVREL